MTEPKPKKSLWDIIDNWLPTATTVYGKIREGKTGVNPYESDSGFVDTNNDMPEDSLPENSILIPKSDDDDDDDDDKKSKTLLYVLGGVALIGLGIGTYFLIKKNKKS